jgi:hypothetical protein
MHKQNLNHDEYYFLTELDDRAAIRTAVDHHLRPVKRIVVKSSRHLHEPYYIRIWRRHSKVKVSRILLTVETVCSYLPSALTGQALHLADFGRNSKRQHDEPLLSTAQTPEATD